MKTLPELTDTLTALDGRGYKAYKTIRGTYEAGAFRLSIDHVQGDPFAEPSRFSAVLPAEQAGFPEWARSNDRRRRAAADFLNRQLSQALGDRSRSMGSGKSGILRILEPGQQVLARTSLALDAEGTVRARFRAGLPARGRRIAGPAAADLVRSAVDALETTLPFAHVDADLLREWVETVEDAGALRDQLPEHDLVAFVADGARLPRRSGIDDRPLEGDIVVPFNAPESLRVALEAPNAGSVTGLGVPAGVTLIVGGGYHGKSTLLRAIERGVYDHVPGDGRERVVAVGDAVKVRAEDGRRVAGTDISNFITRLPSGDDTTRFHTENASGSTSQAAAIVEALELGASCLLLDEDTSATNFMIRDARMQALVEAENEPITPFIDRARQLFEDQGVSTIVVVGGSGDYFDIADTVIVMRGYRPAEVTAEAKRTAEQFPTRRRVEGGGWSELRPRGVTPQSIDPSRGRKPLSIRVRSRDRVDFGSDQVDLSAVEQIVETAQTRALAHAAVHARDTVFQERLPLGQAVTRLLERIREAGLETVHPHQIGELAEFRTFELAAFLNRLRSLRTEPPAEETV